MKFILQQIKLSRQSTVYLIITPANDKSKLCYVTRSQNELWEEIMKACDFTTLPRRFEVETMIDKEFELNARIITEDEDYEDRMYKHHRLLLNKDVVA